jgi:microcystin-dependent protein
MAVHERGSTDRSANVTNKENIMLIVCTKDPTIVQTAQNPASGSREWGPLIVINATLTQALATQSLVHALGQLGPNEALCFSAHGNDTEIGDAGGGVNDWGWTHAEIASLLAQNAPHYAGPILIHACAQRVSNFSAALTMSLQNLRNLNGVWIYGYNRPVAEAASFPNPATMGQNVELQGAHVHFVQLARPMPSSGMPAAPYPPLPAPCGPLPIGVPVGSVVAFAGTIFGQEGAGVTAAATAPAGWMVCDGRKLDRARFPELFTVIGYRYLLKDEKPGVLYYRLPDLQGYFLRGVDPNNTIDPDPTARKTPAGEDAKPQRVGSVQGFALQRHEHTYVEPTIEGTTPGEGKPENMIKTAPNPTNGVVPAQKCPEPVTSDNETRAINVGVYYIIKI